MLSSTGLLTVLCLSLGTAVQAQENVERYGQTDIQEILDTHNDLRRSLNDAADMMEIVSVCSSQHKP